MRKRWQRLEGMRHLMAQGSFRVLLILILATANVALLTRSTLAHWWEHPSGDCHYFIEETTIEVYRGTSRLAVKQAALDDWDSDTDVNFNISAEHHPSGKDPDIAMFYSSYGETGWSGLASIIDLDLDGDYCGFWPNWAEINHGHAQWNRTYRPEDSDGQGILCQEVGHLLGLNHCIEGDGDCAAGCGCMGKTYCNEINSVGAHEAAEINSFY